MELPIDDGIKHAVEVLQNGGVETFESCEGGEGHCSPEPFIRFHGNAWAGYHAVAVAMSYGLPVLALHREYPVIDGELAGPYWQMIFRETVKKMPEERG